jgi:LysR family transcriptional regulator, cyn operon transcriptional activator
MTPELRHLRYLLAVAEQRNFTRAAEVLHLSQPTLSQQIKQLERAVGAQLLDRSGRSVRLTDAGTVYIGHARRALQELSFAERAVRDVEDLTRGHLRLAVTPTFTAYLVGDLAAELRALYPGITLTVTETTQDLVESGLLADDFDLGVAFAGVHLGGIDATALFTETLSLVAGVSRRGSPQVSPLSVQDLANEDLALLTVEFATRRQIDGYLRENRVRPRITVEANSIQAVIDVVSRTGLATVLPDAITDDHPKLVRVPLEPTVPPRTVVLLRREHAYQSAASRAFTELIERWVHARSSRKPSGSNSHVLMT